MKEESVAATSFRALETLLPAVVMLLAALFPGRMVCPGSEREAAALLGGAAMVVSMRLHGLILAGKAPGRIALATEATADKLVAEVGGENVEKINKKFQKKAIQTPKNIV